jgi:DNA-directed RNA polymerase alpha subunit
MILELTSDEPRTIAHRRRLPGERFVVGAPQGRALLAQYPDCLAEVGMALLDEHLEIEQTNIADLGLGARTENALREADVHTVEQLRALIAEGQVLTPDRATVDLLTTIKGIGDASAAEIVQALEVQDDELGT